MRRARLAEEIGEDAIAIIPAAVEVIRSNDNEYEFRPGVGGQLEGVHRRVGIGDPPELLWIAQVC